MADSPRPVPPAVRLLPSHLAWLVGVATLWGYNFVPIKLALDEVPPLALASLRFLLAAIPAILFVKPPRAPLATVVSYGLAIGVGQFGLLFLAIKVGMPAGLASLVAQVQVFFTIALGVRFVGDRLNPHHVAGAVVAAAGLAVLGGHRLAAGSGATIGGFLLVIGAAASWAVGNILAKRAARTHGVDAFALVVWSSLAAPAPLAALSFVFEGGVGPWFAVAGMSPRGWASVLFIAYGATLFGFASWNWLLHRYETALVSPFSLIVPVAGLASGVLFLDERLGAMDAAAAVLVFGGLALTVVGPGLARLAAAR